MKARIPPKIPKQLKQEAERIAKNAYEQIREKENKDITRRVFKTMLYALHKDFCIRILVLAETVVQRH